MDRDKRLLMIREIEVLVRSRVICYVTGDRENVNTRIAPDIIRVFYRHLEEIGQVERLHLFLYTRGGDVLTPWRLINLLREYTNYLGVLVPFRAYSAGTLICLGTDEIVMTKMGELGPIDPSVANTFNPQDPNNPLARIPVSVEDVSSYFALAQEKLGLSSTELTTAFNFLSEKVHPLALGNVHRNYALIRALARKLLMLGQAGSRPEVVQEIIDNLTEKLYAHSHIISRREARQDIRLHVTEPDAALEKVLWELFQEYESYLELADPFDPVTLLGEGEQHKDFSVVGGVIESLARLDGFIFQGTVARPPLTAEGARNTAINISRQGWQELV